MRRILFATVAAGLMLAGCGSSDGGSSNGSLDDVKITKGDAPQVSVPKGFSVDKTVDKVLKAGTGADIAEGDSVKVNYVAVNGRTGKQFDSSFTTGTPYSVDLITDKILPGFLKGLVGKKLGSTVLVAMSPNDGFNAAQEQLDIKKNDTLVFLFEPVSKVPTEATGAAQKLPSSVPKITYDADQHPDGFTKTSKTEAKPAEAKSYVSIEGDGPVVKAGQSVRFEYVGQVYPGGKTFDESWTKPDPTLFAVGTGKLIPCWDKLIPGQKIGSRIVLVCPADSAYGDSPTSPDIKPGDTLIFAIDLLDAS